MLEALGNLGEFVGGLAVIVTLVYLATQIRQNTQVMRAAAEASVVSGAATTVGLPAQSPENAAVFFRGLFEPESLSPEQRGHFFLQIANLFVVFDHAYEAHRDGLVSDRRWAVQWKALQVYATRPGVWAWWGLVGKQIFGPDSDFARLVEPEMLRHMAAAGEGAGAEAPSRGPDVPCPTPAKPVW